MCITAFCSACQDQAKVRSLETASTGELEELQSAISLQLDSTGHVAKGFAVPSVNQGQFWNEAFKICFADNLTARNDIFTKRLIYLGPSNNKYLGTILDSKGRTRRTLTSIIPISEFTKFTDIGTLVNDCDLTHIRKLSLSVIMSGAVVSTIDANLNAAIESADSVVVTGGSWQKDDFRIDDFLDYINNDSNSSELKKYRTSLLTQRNKVITLIYKVNGFKAKAYLSHDIGVDLAAKLKNTISVKVPNIETLSASIKFSSSTKNQVDVSSTNSFYVFANVWVGNALKQ